MGEEKIVQEKKRKRNRSKMRELSSEREIMFHHIREINYRRKFRAGRERDNGESKKITCTFIFKKCKASILFEKVDCYKKIEH